MMKRIIALVIAVMMVASLTACGKTEGEEAAPKADNKNMDIVITEGLSEGQIFRMDNLFCTIPEANIFMHTSQDQYASVFGTQILDREIDGQSLSDELKDTTLARLAQIKAMTLMAESMELSLSDEMENKINAAAAEYMQSLSNEQINAMEINKDIVAELYKEYALSSLCYDEVTKDVAPEVSDDEARAMTVKSILIKTYSTDGDGKIYEYTPSQKADAQYEANKVLGLIKDGEDFDAVLDKYNESDEDTYTFIRGEMPKSFEDAAFELERDEVSPVVETEYGYHIIKCIETLDRAATDTNKERIIQKAKDDCFNEAYEEFIKTIYSDIDQELWDNLEFSADSNMNTVDFFDIYNKQFEN